MSKKVLSSVLLIIVVSLVGLVIGFQGSDGSVSANADAMCGRTVFADVVALDQDFYYNRLGAINANGMMYALATPWRGMWLYRTTLILRPQMF
jgi:hypothetical protein